LEDQNPWCGRSGHQGFLLLEHGALVVVAPLDNLPPVRRGKSRKGLAEVVWLNYQHSVGQHFVGALVGSLRIICRDHAEIHAMQPTDKALLAAVPRHPLPLMFPAVFADTASHIGGVGAVLQVAAAGRCKGFLERRRPLCVGLGEPPDLIRRQLQIAQHSSERSTGIDAIQELLARLSG
jgi:hypothetical protein